jgi:hypothetical protein
LVQPREKTAEAVEGCRIAAVSSPSVQSPPAAAGLMLNN